MPSHEGQGRSIVIVIVGELDCPFLVGCDVHIRQTNFKKHAGGRYHFATADHAGLMQHCQQLFQSAGVGFLVVSDEPHNSSIHLSTLITTLNRGFF